MRRLAGRQAGSHHRRRGRDVPWARNVPTTVPRKTTSRPKLRNRLATRSPLADVRPGPGAPESGDDAGSEYVLGSQSDAKSKVPRRASGERGRYADTCGSHASCT